MEPSGRRFFFFFFIKKKKKKKKKSTTNEGLAPGEYKIGFITENNGRGCVRRPVLSGTV